MSVFHAGEGRTGVSTGQPSSSASALSPVPTSVRAALTDLNWRRVMEEEFATLIANNT
jgi:hypothetical protein